MDVSRRNLLKLVGLTTAGAMLPGCEETTHRLVPYLLPDEEIIPGKADWYASICRECEAGCGVIVRTMEGRAKKVEGNPGHPVNQGKLCGRGHAALQRLYNPDRLRGPLAREGRRGEGRFRPITWAEGLEMWTEQLRRQQDPVAMISRPVSGTLELLLAAFLKATGGGPLLFYDPSAELNLRSAIRSSFGLDQLPHYDLAHADYVLSFGAPFLEHWLSPVSFGRAFGFFRQGRPGVRGRLVQIEPRLSLTAANADRWVPVRPGTEGLLAIGIGLVMLQEGLAKASSAERQRLSHWYGGLEVPDIARATEVSREDLVRLSREFSRASAPLALGGGMAAAHTHGHATMVAVHALNVLAGNLGRPGGLQWSQPVTFASDPKTFQLAGEQAVADLARQVERGAYRMLHLYDTNPLFTIPPSMGVGSMFEKADYIVSFSSFLDESTAMADLILPDHTTLESWGDHQVRDLLAGPAIGLGQPVVTPLYDTRSIGDVFLQASQRLAGDGGHPLPWHTFYEMVRSVWKATPAVPSSSLGSPGEFEARWIRSLQAGGWWEPAGDSPSRPPYETRARYRDPTFAGQADAYPFYFYPFPSLALNRGEGANLPWLQELPDTLTTAMWGSWVEMNPSTARRLGLRQNDLVRVVSPYGQVEAPLLYYPGIRPDLIAMPIGQGHQDYGRYATGRGVNPLTLLGPMLDEQSGALASGATRVRVEATGRSGRLVLYERTSERGGNDLMTIERKTT